MTEQKVETRAEKRRRLVESEVFVIHSGRMSEEIDDYIKEMRENDRFKKFFRHIPLQIIVIIVIEGTTNECYNINEKEVYVI